jgi:hypothetical protein
MKVNTIWIRSMDTECSNGKLETPIEEITKMMKGKDMGKCIGLMDLSTRVSGVKVFSMDMEV